jgi:hypothetical protein
LLMNTLRLAMPEMPNERPNESAVVPQAASVMPHRLLLGHHASQWRTFACLSFLLGFPQLTPLLTRLGCDRYSNVVGYEDDNAQFLVRDAADNIIVNGWSFDGSLSDVVTVKYSGSDGSVLWQKIYAQR